MTSPSRAAWRANLWPALNLLVFGAALWGVDHALRDYRPRDIAHALAQISPVALLLALATAAAGYLALVGYDRVALQMIGHPIPYRILLVPSFVAFAVANTAPASVLSSVGMRYRMYKPLGLDGPQATAVAAIGALTYAVGLAAVFGVVLLVRPADVAPIGPVAGRLVGAILLAAVATYIAVAVRRRRPVRLLGHALRPPAPSLVAAQLSVSCADWLLSSGALFILIASVGPVPYLSFLGTFLTAQMAALLLPIPGGLGVFEAAVLLQAPGGASGAELLAALLAYRLVYYLFPLLAAGVLLAVHEGRRVRAGGATAGELIHRITGLAPKILAGVTFLAGALLLLTGAVPTDERRLAWLTELLPLPFVAASHFLGSIVGAALVVLAWGLERGIRLAYRWVRILYLAGILLSLTRGLDWRVAVVLTACLGIVALSGRAFPRPNPLLREPMGSGWIFAVGAALLVSVWIGRFVHLHAILPAEPWWRYTLFGAAPPWVRAGVGAAVAVSLFALARLLGRHAPQPGSSEGGDLGDRGS